MKPITLNLATRPFRNNAVVASVLAGAATVLVLATVANLFIFLGYGSSYATLRQQESADKDRIAGFETEERGLLKEVQARNFRRAFDRGRIANDMILRRSFSWTLLFNKLEAVIPPDVMMSAIRPMIGTDGIVIRVEGVAKSTGAFIDLQDALLKSPVFARVDPKSERRLNPARPEITFVLNFDYLPQKAAGPPPAMVAVNEPVPSEVAPPAATPAPDAAILAGAVVGRDGLPRTGEPDRIVAAPGGVYVPARLAETAPPAAPGAPPRSGRTSSSRGGPAADSAGAAAERPAAGAPLSAAGRTEPRPPAPASGEMPARPATAPRDDAGVAAAAPGGVPSPAVRLDVPLAFSARPVAEIYDALARAHGVRFDLEASVDRGARVTANLGGMPLADAIAVVGRAAGHRIVRRQAGAYRVALAAGGEPIVDRPIREESIPAEGAP